MVETSNFVGHGIPRGEHQYWSIEPKSSDLLQKRDAVEFRKHHIQEDEVVRTLRKFSDTKLAIPRKVDDITVRLESFPDKAGDLFFVFDYQNMQCNSLRRN